MKTRTITFKDGTSREIAVITFTENVEAVFLGDIDEMKKALASIRRFERRDCMEGGLSTLLKNTLKCTPMYPPKDFQPLYIDSDGKPRLELIVSLGLDVCRLRNLGPRSMDELFGYIQKEATPKQLEGWKLRIQTQWGTIYSKLWVLSDHYYKVANKHVALTHA